MLDNLNFLYTRLTYAIFVAEWWSTYGGCCPNLSRL